LPHFNTSVVNTYYPPLSSAFSKPFSVFLDKFSSFLSTVTTPHEFLTNGDFNLHLDDISNKFSSQFLCLLFSFNLTQQVKFTTHNKNHILDIVITPSDSSLSPSLSTTLCSPSEHFSIVTKLSVYCTSLPPLTLHSFHRLHFSSPFHHSFVSDFQASRLIIFSYIVCVAVKLCSFDEEFLRTAEYMQHRHGCTSRRPAGKNIVIVVSKL